MISGFIFSYSILDFAFFTFENEKLFKKKLLKEKEIEILEYQKNDVAYWDKTTLHSKIIHKTLFIAKYSDLSNVSRFLFDNITSYTIYEKAALQVKNKDKCSTRK